MDCMFISELKGIKINKHIYKVLHLQIHFLSTGRYTSAHQLESVEKDTLDDMCVHRSIV